MVSADTSISCTQPTRHFCKPLTHNKLQKSGVGRHFNFVHSADTTFLQTVDTQRVTKPRCRPTPHESALSRHPPQNPTNNNNHTPYTHTPNTNSPHGGRIGAVLAGIASSGGRIGAVSGFIAPHGGRIGEVSGGN